MLPPGHKLHISAHHILGHWQTTESMATPPKYIIIQIYKNTLCSEEEQPQRNKLGVRNEVICKPSLAQGRNGTPPLGPTLPATCFVIMSPLETAHPESRCGLEPRPDVLAEPSGCERDWTA